MKVFSCSGEVKKYDGYMVEEQVRVTQDKERQWCSWLAEQGVWGSNPGLATLISEIRYLLLPSRDMTERWLK